MEGLLWNEHEVARLYFAERTLQELAQLDLHLRLDLLLVDPRAETTNEVEPLQVASFKEAAGLTKERLVAEGDKKPSGICAKALAVKTGRSEADYRERIAVEDEYPTDHRRILPEFFLPGAIADHSDRRGSLLVVGGPKQTASISIAPQCLESISGDVFGGEGFSRVITALAPHADKGVSGLERRQLGEFGGVVAEML